MRFIHEGFYNYLHQGEGTDVGVFDNLLPILNKHPTYGLNVTGHSLGGALASLFAVSAACREDIPKVRLIWFVKIVFDMSSSHISSNTTHIHPSLAGMVYHTCTTTCWRQEIATISSEIRRE